MEKSEDYADAQEHAYNTIIRNIAEYKDGIIKETNIDYWVGSGIQQLDEGFGAITYTGVRIIADDSCTADKYRKLLVAANFARTNMMKLNAMLDIFEKKLG